MGTCAVCRGDLEEGTICGVCEFMEIEQYREDHPGLAFCLAKEVRKEMERAKREGIERDQLIETGLVDCQD